MGFFSKLFGGKTNAERDAEALYFKMMSAARRPEFYGAGGFEDSYDGRIEVITLHMAGFLYALRNHGQPGQVFGQALFDTMKDDFEVALREEGISDTGVKKRIKPMIGLFYERVKEFTDAIDGSSDVVSSPNQSYLRAFNQNLSGKTLGQIALGDFEFPTYEKPAS